jgi:uracil-DNA glycosylase
MNWDTALKEFMSSDHIKMVKEKVKEDKKTMNVYPDAKDMFRALHLCQLQDVRVVILGQDPYHTPGTADGLCFSTRQEKRPPSLNVIFKEIYRDLQIHVEKGISMDEYFPTNSLENWTKLGFLLLNTSLTVVEGKAGSHADIGWNLFTEKVIEIIATHVKRRVIYLLWGAKAQEYIPLIEKGRKDLYFTAPHPAAEMYGNEKKFTGCGHFSIAMSIISCWASKSNPDYQFGEDLIKVIKEMYPEHDRILQYKEKGWIFSNPVNKDKYFKNCNTFESLISTKN